MTKLSAQVNSCRRHRLAFLSDGRPRNSDGSLRWPTVRDRYFYGSTERRLERCIVKALLRNPLSDQVVLRSDRLSRSLGPDWQSRISSLSSKSLSDVSCLVAESCVRVSLVVGVDTVTVRPY
jgi:hypothetical protein